MAIAFRDTAKTATGAAQVQVTVTIPSTVIAGDLLLFTAQCGYITTFNTPSGWTAAGAQIDTTSASAKVFWRVAQSGDAGATVTATTTGGAGGRFMGFVEAYSGTDSTTPINAFGGLAAASSTTSHVTPVVSSTVAGWVVQQLVEKSSSVTAITSPGSTTRRETLLPTPVAGQSDGASVDSNANVAAGSVGGGTFTTDFASANAAKFTIALAPLATGGTATPATVAATATVGSPVVSTGSRVTTSVVAAVAAAASPSVDTADIDYEETWDGADGTTVTGSPEVFNYGGTGTLTRSTSVVKKGTASGRFVTSGNFRYGALTTANQTTAYWSFYVRPTAAPSVNTSLFFVGADAVTQTLAVYYNTDRTMKIQKANGAAISGNTSGQLVLNEWNRVDVSCVAGTITLEIYPGTAQCDQAAGTASSGNIKSGAAGATAITYRALGVILNSTNDLYLDAWRESSSSLPGPDTLARTVSPASVAATASVGVPTVTTGTTTGGLLTTVQGWRTTTTAATTTTTLNATWASTPTTGNLLLMAVNCENSVSTPSGWTLAASQVSGSGLYLFYKIADGSETTTQSVTASAASSFVVSLAEYFGQATSPLDVVSSAASGTSALTTGTANLTGPTDLAVAVFGSYGTGPSGINAQTGGFTEQQDWFTTRTTGTDVGLSVSTLRTTDSGAVSSTATASGTVTGGAGLVAGFKLSLANSQPRPTAVAEVTAVAAPTVIAFSPFAPATVAAVATVEQVDIFTTGFTAVPAVTVAARASVFTVARVTAVSTVTPPTVAVVATTPSPTQIGDGVGVTVVLASSVQAVAAVGAPTIPASASAVIGAQTVAAIAAVPTVAVFSGTATVVPVETVAAVGRVATPQQVLGSSVGFGVQTVNAVTTVPPITITTTPAIYVFVTPYVDEGPLALDNPLFGRMGLRRGVTVLFTDGQPRQVRFASAEEIDAADFAYLGGYQYLVTGAEAQMIANAGYDLRNEGEV